MFIIKFIALPVPVIESTDNGEGGIVQVFRTIVRFAGELCGGLDSQQVISPACRTG